MIMALEFAERLGNPPEKAYFREHKSSTSEVGELTLTRIPTNISEIYGKCNTSTRRNGIKENKNLSPIPPLGKEQIVQLSGQACGIHCNSLQDGSLEEMMAALKFLSCLFVKGQFLVRDPILSATIMLLIRHRESNLCI
ncbi:hypothetical protein Q9966_014360 [Columba livia]|nr:hypothetical protein Q9966_014360 [Columba livia]